MTALTSNKTVEIYVAPKAKIVKIRDHTVGTPFKADKADKLLRTMIDAGTKYQIPVSSIFCPDIEKGRKGGFRVNELTRLDMTQYNVRLLQGKFGPYVAVLHKTANSTPNTSNIPQTIVI